jgi:protein-S-isoprenylcysteine O-methyltransferase Ste14
MDAGGFFNTPARLGYIILVTLLNAFAAIRIPEVGKSHAAGKKTVRPQHLAVVLLQVISVAVLVAAPFCDRRGIAVLNGMELFRYVGLGMYSFGFLLMHWAEGHLGKMFSVEVTVQEGHRLVTDGPYRYLRHPRYLGIIIFAKGIALVFRSEVGLVLIVALFLVLLWRIRDEEALMRQEIGPAWEAYSRKSWRLIPFVY